MDEAIERTMDQLWKGGKKWHLLIYHLWVIPANMVLALFSMSVVFAAGVPDHHCTVSDNSSLPRKQNGQPESCLIYSNLTRDNKTEQCSNWTYPDKDYGITIVSEWDLVCDHNLLAELSQSFYIMGAIVATLLVSPLADNYGRKRVYLIFNALLVVTGVATAYSVNYAMFTVFRVLSGIFGYACLFVAIVAGVELFPKHLRTFAGQIMFVWWSLGMMFLDLLAYSIRNWRHLQLAVALIPLTTVIDIWLIPESVPWLLSKGKVEQAEEIVKKAAAFNGTTLPEHPFKVEAEVKEEKELGRKALFREPILRRITLILCALWFVNNLVYYGLSLSAAELAGDRFLNFFLMALVEIPATVCCMLVLESRAGRRMSLSSFHVLAGISLIILVFIPPVTANGTDLTPLAVFMTLVGKFSITASYDVVIQYSLELFPTCIRNTGLGTASFTAPVAGSLAPFAAYLARVVPWAPGVIFGIMSLLVGILALLLPETRGRPLPHSVEDMEQWQLPNLTCGSLHKRKKNKSINVSNEENKQVTTLLLLEINVNHSASQVRLIPFWGPAMDEAIERTLSQLWTGGKKWHLLTYHYWVIPVNIVIALFTMSAVFTAGVPDHHCTVSDNSSLPRKQNGQPESCLIYSNLTHDNKTEKCSNWTYPDRDYGITIVSEWGLVCDYDYLGDLSQSFYIIGSIIATVLVTPLADTFGRKLVYLVLNGLLVIFGIATAYSVNYIMFTVFRVLSGIVGYACLLIAVVATVELFPKKLRAFAGQIMWAWWSIGMMVVDLMAYFIRNWRHLQLAVALMPIITIMDIWLIPESVPWLLSKGKVEQAEEIVKKAAAFNGTTLPEHPFKVEAEVKEEKELGRMTLFRVPILRKITLILSILWFVNNLVYYGLSLSAAVLAGDRFLNFFLTALVEIPATICAMFLMESRAGRRITLIGFHVFAGISLILLVFIPPVTESGIDLTPLAVFFTLVGKFSITASYDVVAQYTLELYPTCLRNTGLGTASFTAPVAGTLAPFTAYLARLVPWAPGVIFGTMSLFVGILALLLPETRGRPLPHSVKDMEKWQLPNLTCGSLHRRKKNKSINVNSNEGNEQATTLL
ncbi:uncharacterized protein LOC141905342 [Tubulanus polymorphus]|uniref:uncharacterized protein LOC141905342 n=1 Tax=Tubulanus polymorphus TaxID=672921 RepID=UPI003DA606FC